jgi:Ca2+-binding EF-hand superfamily protein
MDWSRSADGQWSNNDAAPLKTGWEAVAAPDGRVYFWNSDTDETTWERPVAAVTAAEVKSPKAADVSNPKATPVLTHQKSTPTAQRIAAIMEGEPSRMAADMLFKYYDRDGNRMLDAEETALMLAEYGFNDEQAVLIREMMDGDGDGRLTFEEFWNWLQQKDKLDLIRDDSRFHLLKEAGRFFNSADVDGDGTISRSELAVALQSQWGQSAEDAEDMVQQIDRDGNDLISLNEYLTFLAGYPEWQGLRVA